MIAGMIVYCCNDLMFATRIRATAEAMAIPSRPGRDAAALQARLDQVDDGRLNDPVTGVLVDLDTPNAIDLIKQVKTHQPQLPVVAFGSHVLTELLQEARTAGADFVMSRGSFTANLKDILERFRDEPEAE